MTIYQDRLTNSDGSTNSVAEIVAELQADGTDQRLIDRWLQGLEAGARARNQRRADR